MTPKLMENEELLFLELGLGGGTVGMACCPLSTSKCTTACPLGWPKQKGKMAVATTAPRGKRKDSSIVDKELEALEILKRAGHGQHLLVISENRPVLTRQKSCCCICCMNL